MARNTFEPWIPEEYGSEVITRITQTSAVEALASRIPMASDTRHTPRSAGMGVDVVDKGSAYGEDTSLNDEVILYAKKFGKVIRVAEEDINDSLANILATKMKGELADDEVLEAAEDVARGVDRAMKVAV